MKRIAIIGASARAAAMSARRAGLQVVAADLFADVDLRTTCPAVQIKDYPYGFVDWLFDQKIDDWIFTGALENYPEVVDKLATIAPLLGVSGKVLRQVRDPYWLASQCQAEHFLFPPLLSCNGFHDGQAISVGQQWLAKTYQHSSGIGTWALDIPTDWKRAQESHAVAQLRISGISRSAIYALTNQGAHLYGMSEQLISDDELGVAQLTRARPWQYAGSLASEAPLHHIHVIHRIGNWLHNVGLRGIVGVDLIDDGNSLWLIEVNPRYTASVEVIERSTQKPLFNYWQFNYAVNCLHHKQKPQQESVRRHAILKKIGGKVILYAKEDVKISAQFKDWAIRLSAAQLAADIPHENTLIMQGHPVLTLFSETYAGVGSRQRLANSLKAILKEAERYLYD